MKLGLIGSLLAIVALIATLIYVESTLQIGLLENKTIIFGVLIGVLGLGVLITGISTHFATQRFLNLRTDDLY